MIIPKRMYKKMTEPVKDTAQKPVEQSGEVDDELDWIEGHIEYYEGLAKTRDSIYQHDVMTLKRIKQLLSHLPTSGNDMSDKRTVAREWIEKELNAHLRLGDEALRDYVHVIADIIVEIFTAFGIEVMEK